MRCLQDEDKERNMKGKKAIVTGGGSGYGKGVAASLVAAGAEVWITGRNRITEWGHNRMGTDHLCG